jgi:hypothetical protein
MKPVSFPEQNKVYTAPLNWNAERDGPCGDLPVRQENGAVTSCYEIDEEDISHIMCGAKLYFTIYTDVQPVVSWEIR